MLPYGYSVSLLLCIFPPIWRKVIDPVAIATNKGEKVSDDFRVYQERLVLATLACTSIFFTYVCFFAIGFSPKF
jgi:hypothetical protein